jgi:hypothetical protein
VELQHPRPTVKAPPANAALLGEAITPAIRDGGQMSPSAAGAARPSAASPPARSTSATAIRRLREQVEAAS